jgi:RNA polymerase sigma factor (sigma-70 family)
VSRPSSPKEDRRFLRREQLRLVEAEIRQLPIRLREALVLVSVEGRSQAEAAALLGTTEKAIETRIYRARNRLRERVKNFEGFS